MNSKYFGFTGNFRIVCEGDIDIVDEEKEYYLESPGFPNRYKANKYCLWHLDAPPNRKIILKFNYFQLEASENCKNDYVEIRDGNYYYSPLIGKYCNNTIPEEIWSRGNTLYVKFRSNNQIQDNGFSAVATLRKLYY